MFITYDQVKEYCCKENGENNRNSCSSYGGSCRKNSDCCYGLVCDNYHCKCFSDQHWNTTTKTCQENKPGEAYNPVNPTQPKNRNES